MARRAVLLIVFCLVARTVCGGLIGGSPSEELTAVLTGPGGALVEIYSAVFAGPGSLPADSGISLQASEKVYAYVLFNRAESAGAVERFGLSVPSGVLAADIGWYDSDTGKFQGVDETAPGAYDLTSKGLDFDFTGDELDPAADSEVMFFVSAAPADLVLAQVHLAGGGDAWGTVLGPSALNGTYDVPHAIPEPGWVFLPGLLFAAAARRRISRAA